MYLVVLLLFSAKLFSSENQELPPPVRHYESFPETPANLYTGEILDFYSTKNPYGEFSNFALFPVFVDGKWWSSSEHYYQSNKYDLPELIEWVRSAATPNEAALRGRDKNIPKRADWDQLKDEIMARAVRDKFRRYPKLQALLLATNSAKIFEHTKNDCYWGDCEDRTGKNKLGVLLETIRMEIKLDSRNSIEDSN